MKPAVMNHIQRTGNLAGESVTMTVDVTAMEHIMTLLTDLYSDRELAVIREYSTNALDSHVEAGNTQPIEISTPGPLNPFFKVKDYGIGLDSEGIRNIYSKYGASTKRDTDAQVGMLGLGCKSALTYAPQFTLVGIKDGRKTVVAISRDEKGRGNMEILEELETTEPNGVEIMIPVTGRNSFVEKANKFFSFWKPGTVLVNGNEPKAPELTFIDDNVYIAHKDFGDYVVMGNVAYPVKDALVNPSGSGWSKGYSVVAYVNIGDVHFTPSREALHYTPHTESRLVDIRLIVQNHIADAIQREITQANSAREALDSFVKWRSVLQNSYRYPRSMPNFSWNGVEVTDEYTNLDNFWEYTIGSRNGSAQTKGVRFNLLEKATVRIVGFPEDTLEPKHKTRIRTWLNAQSRTHGVVVVCDKLPGTPFTDAMDTVSWKTIVEYKAPRAKRDTTAPKTWPVIDQYGNVKDGGTIDLTKPVFYIERKRRGNFTSGINRITGLEANFVAVPTNRMSSFKKSFPQATELGDWLRQKAKDALDKFTNNDYAKMKLEPSDVQLLKHLDPAKIEDKEMLIYINVAQGVEFSPAVAELEKWNSHLSNFGYQKLSIPNTKIEPIFSSGRYPLIDGIGWWSLRQIKNGHIELYINAVFNSEKGSN